MPVLPIQIFGYFYFAKYEKKLKQRVIKADSINKLGNITFIGNRNC